MSMVVMKLASAVALHILVLMALYWVLVNSCSQGEKQFLFFEKVIRVTWSRRDPNARKSGRGNMLVKNLAESIDKTGLYDLFEKYENILSSKVICMTIGKAQDVTFFNLS